MYPNLNWLLNEERKDAEEALKIIQSQETVDKNLEEQAINNLKEIEALESFVNSARSNK